MCKCIVLYLRVGHRGTTTCAHTSTSTSVHTMIEAKIRQKGFSHELWTFRSQDHSLPGAKVPGVELTLPGTFAPTNECSKER